jgi:adenine-specific DNA-methyltransferase
MTDIGDSVLDPYAGMGSSLIAALRHGRRAFGCDTSEKYVEIAKQRIALLEKGELPMRPMDKPIYGEELRRS